MMAAQAAADAAAAAMTKQIGTDQPFIPPIGTPGMILVGSPNVMVGGFPLPNFSAIAQGLLKRVKGLKFDRRGRWWLWRRRRSGGSNLTEERMTGRFGPFENGRFIQVT